MSTFAATYIVIIQHTYLPSFDSGGTKEIVNIAIVQSTSVSQVSHLLSQCRKYRKNFTPGALYTDITPANEDFWKKLLGADMPVLLGLFHVMQRVLDTLDHRCELHWEALVALQCCFYKHCENDHSLLLEVLKLGLLGGKKCSDSQIKNFDIQKSGIQGMAVTYKK